MIILSLCRHDVSRFCRFVSCYDNIILNSLFLDLLELVYVYLWLWLCVCVLVSHLSFDILLCSSVYSWLYIQCVVIIMSLSTLIFSDLHRDSRGQGACLGLFINLSIQHLLIRDRSKYSWDLSLAQMNISCSTFISTVHCNVSEQRKNCCFIMYTVWFHYTVEDFSMWTQTLQI